MLSFDIRSLESRAVVVDEILPSSDAVWKAGDPTPVDGMHVTGRLSSAGPGRFYWHGRIKGDVALDCSRCLEETRAYVSDESHIIFVERGDDDIDDPDVYLLDPAVPELDLRPALREQWVLAAPTFAVCREDCQGLCPRCGADLNAGPHDCAQTEVDPRWGTLTKLDGSTK